MHIVHLSRSRSIQRCFNAVQCHAYSAFVYRLPMKLFRRNSQRALKGAHFSVFDMFADPQMAMIPEEHSATFPVFFSPIRKPRCSINYLHQEIVEFYYYKIHLSKLFLFSATNIIYHLINETRKKNVIARQIAKSEVRSKQKTARK